MRIVRTDDGTDFTANVGTELLGAHLNDCFSKSSRTSRETIFYVLLAPYIFMTIKNGQIILKYVIYSFYTYTMHVYITYYNTQSTSCYWL